MHLVSWLLLLLLAYGFAMGQGSMVPPNAKTGWVIETFHSPMFQFGAPRPETEWGVGEGRTVGVYVYGPQLSRQRMMMLTDAVSDPPTVTAFSLPTANGGFSCGCRTSIEIISWTMLTDSLGELVLRHVWVNGRVFNFHELCLGMCTEYVEKELVYFVDLTGPIHCLACDVPLSVTREVWRPQDGVLELVVSTEYRLELILVGGLLSVLPQTDEIDKEQSSWPGDYELGF